MVIVISESAFVKKTLHSENFDQYQLLLWHIDWCCR